MCTHTHTHTLAHLPVYTPPDTGASATLLSYELKLHKFADEYRAALISNITCISCLTFNGSDEWRFEWSNNSSYSLNTRSLSGFSIHHLYLTARLQSYLPYHSYSPTNPTILTVLHTLPFSRPLNFSKAKAIQPIMSQAFN